MAATAPTDADEVQAAILEQFRELEAAKTLEADLDVAYRLQLQEAMAASLPLQPSSSPSRLSTSPSRPIDFSPAADGDAMSFFKLQAEEIARYEQELADRELAYAAMRNDTNGLKRRVHDRNLAAEILRVPEAEWKNTGDHIERPYGEGSSSSNSSESSGDCYSLCFKGAVREETVGGDRVTVAGIGVAIFDPLGFGIVEIAKPLGGGGLEREVVELEALIECLNTAVLLDLKRVSFLTDDNLIYLYVTGRWQTSRAKIVELLHQVDLLKRNFSYCSPLLVERNKNKSATILAGEAIESQITRSAKSSRDKHMVETCAICLEDTDVRQMFSIGRCLHRYCISCLRQHSVVKLHQAKVPNCPHEGCQSKLTIEESRKFLTHELVEIMSLRIKEATIPATEKVYCPHPRCSALMSCTEVLEHSRNLDGRNSGARKCMKCQGIFCVNCKVPWHDNMSCAKYIQANPHPSAEDAKLKSLATTRKWRQCVKCNHVVELVSGCNHIYCRCGYEFCYICGAEWTKKKQTCHCPVWDERNLIYEENRLRQEAAER